MRPRLQAGRACLAALLLFLGSAPVAALLPAPSTPTATAEEPATTTTIDPQQEAGSDDRIAERIAGIFAELPALSDVRVSVSEGVVSLEGSVADMADSQRAEAIASRVSGVVTIENALRRDVSVDRGLAGLAGVSERFSEFIAMLPLIGAAIVVGLLIAALGYVIASLTGLWNRLARNTFLAGLIASAIRFGFVIGGLVVALDMIGAAALLGAVLGGAGVIGIALGFAMRDTIENYVASLMLSLRQPFRANDHVVIEGQEGRVIRLTSRATILMTLDGNHLRIPNSTVFKAVILNYTRNPQRRFEFLLGIDADDSPDAARALGVKVLNALDFVLAEPEPAAIVEEVGDSNIVIRFLGWMDQDKTDYFKARSRAIPAVKDALESAGFALPEPIYRLRFDSSALPPMALSPQLSDGARTSSAAPAPTATPAKVSPAVDAPAPVEDVSPENEIARMVDAERAMAPGEKDLLDSSRPVE
ncbi:mechanosensitive ion channel [Altererythrobacter endophyticus]|uniref:Small-conductance mechanosensitive channel n=2 Tax=Altericroceibacterium endophyticum TaxID=1808508 RepID=A0A6I4T621_9SPHN|nr:mechanosensitive ion channel [Altericroceibacterium endophyticum]